MSRYILRGGLRKRARSARSRKHESQTATLYGLALIGIAFLAFVSILAEADAAPGERNAGIVGVFVVSVLRGIAGEATLFLTAVMALAGIMMIFERDRKKRWSRGIGLGVVAVSFFGILEIKLGRSSEFGGGLAGLIVSSIFTPFFGSFGSMVVLSLLSLVGLIVAFNIPIRNIFRLTLILVSALVTVMRTVVFTTFFLIRSSFARVIAFFLEEEERPDHEGHLSGGASLDMADTDEVPSRTSGGRPATELAAARETIAGAGKAHGEKGPGGRRLEAGFEVPALDLAGLNEADIGYQLPPISILSKPLQRRGGKGVSDLAAETRILEKTLESFGVRAKVVDINRGPVVTRYEVQPGPGVKVSRIVGLADDLALSLAAIGVRIEAPIPGKSAVGIEVPNQEITLVYLRDILESQKFQSKRSVLTIALGKDIAGDPVVGDLADMLHLLVAGATGSGKSVCLNTLISSILFKARPSEVKFLMIDPKRVELTTYDGIPHLVGPVVTDPKKAAGYLRWVVEEMEDRYKLLQAAGVRNIEKYNELAMRTRAEGEMVTALPYIVVIIDELGDLMLVAQKEVEDCVCRLAFMARAAGIHLVVATQRPSVDVITGVIKMNIPSRIAFAVPSQVDSRIILDISGAERLVGKGDMLFFPVGASKPIRVQGAFVSDSEVEDLVAFLKGQGEPVYEAESRGRGGIEGEGPGDEDSLFDEAVRIVLETGQASVSGLQRRLRVGYARAGRLIDAMERKGLIGPGEGSKPRKVLLTYEEWVAGRRRSPEG